MDIQELTAVIKQDITALNSAVVDLQVLCSSRNESGSASTDTTTHSTTVVDDLKNRLMSATKEFKELLTLRTENLKVHENRRQLFSSSASKNPSNPFVRQRPLAAKPPASSSAAPLFRGPMVHNLHPNYSRRIRRMGSPSLCCSSNKTNSNWFLYRTATCKAGRKRFRMWNQRFMSWATFSIS